MKGMRCLLLFIAVCLVGSSGCAVHLAGDRLAGGFRYLPGSEKALGRENFALLKRRYGREWRLNHGDKEAPPALGLAMSGGGMRSAAFNIGVLQGLHEAGLLERLDLMSSVSGGGYALSWYYLQRYHGAGDAELFDPRGRFQRYLAENGRILTHSRSPLVRSAEYLVKAGANLFSLPFHWLANGLFDWNLNLAPYRWFYQNAIEREFHLTPAPDGGAPDASRFLGLTVGVRREVGFPEMRAFIEREKMPSFIINTTVKISDSMEHYSADFSNAVFEFTPFAYGSDAFGYHEGDFPVDVHTAVAISGAAADSSIMPARLGFMFSALNTDLGYNIPNYNLGSREPVIVHDLLPAPLYFFHRGNRDIRATSIYLTDGGHSDNLGAFSLARRLCRRIIIVDAEHDPDYRFLAYRKLKQRLRAEMGVEFSLPDIDRGLVAFTMDDDGSLARTGTVPAAMRRALGLGEKAAAGYDPEAGAWRISEPGSGLVFTARRQGGRIVVFRPYDGSKPVMRGAIGWFPLDRGHGPERVTLEVIYIKLSLDRRHLEQYPESVRSYCRRKPDWLHRRAGSFFPHESTGDISYGPAQFAAYRDLGRFIVERFLPAEDRT